MLPRARATQQDRRYPPSKSSRNTPHPPRDNLPVARRYHPQPTTRDNQSGQCNDGATSRQVQTLTLVLEDIYIS